MDATHPESAGSDQSLKLFGTVTSPYVRKVRVALREKGVRFDWEPNSLLGDPPLIESYNPLSKVPVLQRHDGLCLLDSRVILEYVDTLAPHPILLPGDPELRLRVRCWEALADGMVDAGAAVVLEGRRPAPERSLAWVTKQRGKLERGLAYLAHSLGERTWCVGDEFSLADLATATALLWVEFRLPELAWRSAYPALACLVGSLETRPSFQGTEPVA